MPQLEAMLGRISDVVWGPPLLILLFGTHLFLTVRLRFIQRYLGKAIRLAFQRTAEGDGRHHLRFMAAVIGARFCFDRLRLATHLLLSGTGRSKIIG